MSPVYNKNRAFTFNLYQNLKFNIYDSNVLLYRKGFTMLKSAIFKKTVCITTVISFTLANLPRSADAYGYRLTPESFEEMYALAQSGRVEALRSSINRGLNIDVMNSDGDTGL